MIHLTQILVPYELAARQLRIRDTYDWHQRVWQAFGGRDGAPRNFLTRVDQVDDAHRLLIVSASPAHKPDWCPTDCFQTKPIPGTFFAHSCYRFSLLANPTKKIINPKKPKVLRADGRLDRNKNSKRVPLTRRPDLLAWLKRKADEGGFAVALDAVRTIPRGREYFFKPGARGVHNAVEFQGVLKVTDAAKLRETFACGIGSAKAFGFGLLALAPISTGD
ncbi:MAG: type I-E CRISPR-associated protein Cas6/Cse3/CasE [Verrucomicrobiales bacterium]|nr:type I-E CRISPR-associated protein Cas6/Cse3/CasE [Verrucomicrobiales bacterium]